MISERLRAHSVTELGTPSEYAKGWNAAKFRIEQDAREAADVIDAMEASLEAARECITLTVGDRGGVLGKIEAALAAARK